ALEGDRDPISGFGLRALALRGKCTVLVGDPLDCFVNIGVGYLGDRLLDRKTLEIGELDRGNDLDRNGIGQIGLPGEDILNGFLLGRHGDLGFGRQTEAALRENLRVGIADRLIDGFRHHRAAIHFLEVAYRHLAWTKAVETYFVLEVDQASVRLGIEIRCGNADLEFVLQSLSEGLCDLHGVNLLPAWSGSTPTLSIWSTHGTKACVGGSADPILPGHTYPFGNRFLQYRHANAVSAWC